MISLYQRWISPYKGFRCVHTACFGGPSCSRAVKAIIADRGLVRGWLLIRRRFAECRAACRAIQEEAPDTRKNARKRRQRSNEKTCFGNFDPGDGDFCCAADADSDILDCTSDFDSRW